MDLIRKRYCLLRPNNMRYAQLDNLVFSLFPLISSSIDIFWIPRKNSLQSPWNILWTRFWEQATLPMTANEVWRQRTRLENPFEKYYVLLPAANDVLTMSTAFRFFFWNTRNEIRAIFNDQQKWFSLQPSTMGLPCIPPDVYLPEKSVIERVHFNARRFPKILYQNIRNCVRFPFVQKQFLDLNIKIYYAHYVYPRY